MLKCIVWDLDNTILDGVLSEDSKVKLRDGIKDILEAIHEKKVLQTIASKNDNIQALSRLKDLEIIDYFIYPQISWNPKSKSIRRIMDNLHFKAEDVLFLDDQHYELDEVKTAYQDLKTFPSGNLTDMKKYIQDLLADVNSNTIDRIDLYRLEEKRLMDRERYFVTNKEFLLSCQLQVSISRAQEEHIERIRELITRTNQLNLNKREYSPADLRRMIGSGPYEVLIADVKDKYGAYDVSGVLILNYTEELTVDLLIVSCRLLGKGVANALLDYGVQLAIKGQHKRIYVKYKKTPYNRPFLYLLLQCGFKKQGDSMLDPGFYLDLNSDSRLLPDWITIVHSEETEVLQMDKHEVKGFLFEMLIELELASDTDALNKIVYFSDLGADSIALLNIVVLMEEKFKVVFPDEQLTFDSINHIEKFCDFFASGAGLIHG